jgi:hypothetical protein
MNGYIEVDINGQKVGLKFGYPAVKEFTLASVASQDLYIENGNLSDIGIAKLIQCGYNNYCLLQERPPVLKFMEFSEWVEGALDDKERLEVIGNILTVYADSRYTKLAIERMKEQKKSLTKTTKTKTRRSSLKG